MNLLAGVVALSTGNPVTIISAVLWSGLIWTLYTQLVRGSNKARIALSIFTIPVSMLLLSPEVRLYCFQRSSHQGDPSDQTKTSKAATSPHLAKPDSAGRVVGPVPASAQNLQHRMTNSDVLSLKGAGFGDEFIITKIKMSVPDYQLDTAALVELKKSGVSDAVMTAMMETGLAK